MASFEQPRRVVRPVPTEQDGTGLRPPVRTSPPRPVAAGERLSRRTDELLDAVARLDAGLEPGAARDLARWLADRYGSAHGGVPLGFLATCRLGAPYVDHQLTLDHAVLRHFAPGDPVPEPFRAARMLVRTGAYAYVEVYSDGLLLPVFADGGVVRP
ncbi:hypothetical protein [Kitasatospora sp. NPDC088351]|uniref:hypothetical protein n=1 Tax=unclassified Kitasatospora TaxID=2633591 RepID=UPI00344ADB49